MVGGCCKPATAHNGRGAKRGEEPTGGKVYQPCFQITLSLTGAICTIPACAQPRGQPSKE